VDYPSLRRRPLQAGSHCRVAVTVLAEAAPARWLRGRPVIGPDGEHLGVVTLVVRRCDGARLAVVHRRTPSPRRTVLDLTGGTLDDKGFLHVLSDADVALISA
jgi:hypothetical protein